MTTKLNNLELAVRSLMGERNFELTSAWGELTLVVKQGDYIAVMKALRDNVATQFDELIDLCGVDYLTYADGNWSEKRFAVVTHLLSLVNNWRLRVRVFAEDDALPILPSVSDIWNSANWYEREAFDLFGLLFEGHPDLRRILTDYGFIGHPFRKDFPVSGYVEMRYDAEAKRVIYQPITIDPRENTPRIIREESYAK